VVAAHQGGEANYAMSSTANKRGDAPSLIDVHHHFIPPFYLDENRERIAKSRGGGLSEAWLRWSPQRSLDAMDQHSVVHAMLSMSTPGVWFGDVQAARSTARRCNDYAAAVVASHRPRFGHFAAVALPDIEGALREVAYAFDVLRADGIALLTSYDEKWLGHIDHAPVFEELNRRHAVVFVHPTVPAAVRDLLPGISPMIAEVPQDTGRAIVNLLLTGTMSRFSAVRFVFAHAGGTFPMIAGRLHQYVPAVVLDAMTENIDDQLRRCWFDIAGTANEPAIAALTALASRNRILFGSDAPHIPLGETANGMMRLELSPITRAAIGSENATRLFPRIQ
jgi:predicted TIM-barrel fold metal-dependent hydrolase